VPQLRICTHPLPALIHHLYWYGVTPPVAVAVKVMVVGAEAVDTGYGDGRSDVKLITRNDASVAYGDELTLRMSVTV
jgi:hypothetical protein